MAAPSPAVPTSPTRLCLRRIGAADLARLDLSRLSVAYCGAEPVRAASLAAFAAHTAQAGFRPDALLPCYGLAEATLLVSGTAGQGLRTASTTVLGKQAERTVCGTPPSGCRITIRHPQSGALLAPGETGEVCVSGAHVAAGEWEAATGRIVPLSNAAFSEEGERYLRTGDLGFEAPEGLVVVDRIKDMICLQGRNVHAVDVESAAVGAGGGAIAAAAAFAVEDDAKERVVLLCEVPARGRASLDPTLESRLAAAIGADCGVRPQILFMRHGALPRTTSGKIRRSTARQQFQEGLIQPLAIEMPHAETTD
ncbi:AMP-binding protein [Jiella pelagia]|uniref:AMP-binding protein n=1 Tax=Jiella pelagia TaxID=2986949 RepID=A0ABY7C7C9_9HYPH|nr:AMP-binding protein [Jiella pelagia]WAP70720.1 AMP-binding protein [Jiella pelagia]